MSLRDSERVQIVQVAEFYSITPDEVRAMSFEDVAVTLEIMRTRTRIDEFKTKRN